MVFYGLNGSSVAFNGGIARARAFEPATLSLRNSYTKPVSAEVYDGNGAIISSLVVEPSTQSSLIVPVKGHVAYNVARSAYFNGGSIYNVGFGVSSWADDTTTGLSGVIRVRNRAPNVSMAVIIPSTNLRSTFTGINSNWSYQRLMSGGSSIWRAVNELRVEPWTSYDSSMESYQFRSGYYMYPETVEPDQSHSVNMEAFNGSTATGHLVGDILRTGVYGGITALIQSSYYSSRNQTFSYGTIPAGGWSAKSTSIYGTAGHLDTDLTPYMSAGASTAALVTGGIIRRYALSAQFRVSGNVDELPVSLEPVQWTLSASSIV